MAIYTAQKTMFIQLRNGLLIGTLIFKLLVACTNNTQKLGMNPDHATNSLAYTNNIQSLAFPNVYKRLIIAINSGDLRETERLIRERKYLSWLSPIPEINLRDKDGSTLLMLAVSKGHIDIARLLVEKGACTDVQNNRGHTALTCAARHGEFAIIKCLVEHGTHLDVQTNRGHTALMWAARNGHIEIVRFLVERGADKDITNKDGITAFRWASDNRNFDIASFLVGQGAK